MVGLTTYSEVAGHDLARGRHIAGTGGLLGDGTVTTVGAIVPKARGAQRAGAEVLLVPASQAHLLEGIALPGVTVVLVATLQQAIDWLTGDPR